VISEALHRGSESLEVSRSDNMEADEELPAASDIAIDHDAESPCEKDDQAVSAPAFVPPITAISVARGEKHKKSANHSKRSGEYPIVLLKGVECYGNVQRGTAFYRQISSTDHGWLHAGGGIAEEIHRVWDEHQRQRRMVDDVAA
jgi:hypothetical protein